MVGGYESKIQSDVMNELMMMMMMMRRRGHRHTHLKQLHPLPCCIDTVGAFTLLHKHHILSYKYATVLSQ